MKIGLFPPQSAGQNVWQAIKDRADRDPMPEQKAFGDRKSEPPFIYRYLSSVYISVIFSGKIFFLWNFFTKRFGFKKVNGLHLFHRLGIDKTKLKFMAKIYVAWNAQDGFRACTTKVGLASEIGVSAATVRRNLGGVIRGVVSKSGHGGDKVRSWDVDCVELVKVGGKRGKSGLSLGGFLGMKGNDGLKHDI